jgi:SAM-dependent methyltransferase
VARTTHEARVERFYARGVERYGTFHANYLNFGLWLPGVTDYVAASEALLARVAHGIGLGSGSLLLDVGCGMGSQDRFFAERFGCRAIEGVDLTPAHVDVARARNAHPRVTYRVGNACHLPFPDDTFTHAISIEGIVHFDTRAAFLREARRVLRPDGALGVSDFVLCRPLRGRVERLLLRFGAWAWRVPMANAWTVPVYERELRAAGFEQVDVDVVSDAVIPGYVAEQARPPVRREVYAIRGQLLGRLGVLLDVLVLQLYRRGVLGYVVASARTPG